MNVTSFQQCLNSKSNWFCGLCAFGWMLYMQDSYLGERSIYSHLLSSWQKQPLNNGLHILVVTRIPYGTMSFFICRSTLAKHYLHNTAEASMIYLQWTGSYLIPHMIMMCMDVVSKNIFSYFLYFQTMMSVVYMASHNPPFSDLFFNYFSDCAYCTLSLLFSPQ